MNNLEVKKKKNPKIWLSQDRASRSDRDEKDFLICHTGILIHVAYFVSVEIDRIAKSNKNEW
jgi:hypothetical protein